MLEFHSLILGYGCSWNVSCGCDGSLAILGAGLSSSGRLLLADDQGIAILVCEVLDFKASVSRSFGYCLLLD